MLKQQQPKVMGQNKPLSPRHKKSHSKHVSISHIKKLPEIPPYRDSRATVAASESQKRMRQVHEKRKHDPKVRFSLPVNSLLDNFQGETSSELSSVVSNNQQQEQNTKLSSVPELNSTGMRLHHKNLSTQSLPSYKKSKRRNSMFLFETTSHKLNDTHSLYVRPEDKTHFKISIPLVIRTPPKLSKVKSRGDELLDKEMIFNGVSYEMIEIIDDDDIEGNDSVEIIGEKKSRVSDNGSPLRQPPINRNDLKKTPSIPDSPTKVRMKKNKDSGKLDSPTKVRMTSPKKRKAPPPAIIAPLEAPQEREIKEPLKSALKPSPAVVQSQALPQEQLPVQHSIHDQQYYNYPQQQEQQPVQQNLPDSQYYHYPQIQQEYQYPNNQEQQRWAYYLEQQNPYYNQQLDYQNDYAYQQAREYYHYPQENQQVQANIEENPNAPSSYQYPARENVDQQQPVAPLTFPSQEAKDLLRQEQNSIDDKYNKEANEADYTQTVAVTEIPNRQKILAQSPRKHNHTRSKSQINILTEFDGLKIDGNKKELESPRRKHNHTRSKSQTNILTQFDNNIPEVKTNQQPLIYSQTAPVKEIIIPELNNVPLPPMELEKVNSKLDFYLRDQLERNSIRDEPPKLPVDTSSRLNMRKSAIRRPISPLNSHSSHESTLSLGRTNSTIGTSVYDSENIMIDLTHDNQEVLVTRNKLKGSISSYRSIKEKDKAGKMVEMVLVDDDDDYDALGLIDQYASDFEVHDSIRRKTSMISNASNTDELERVYSMYHKFGRKSSLLDPKTQRRSLLKNHTDRIVSNESTYSTSSFQTGDEKNIIVGNIHDWKKTRPRAALESVVEGVSLDSSNAIQKKSTNVANSSMLRQRYPTRKTLKSFERNKSIASTVISEPSSVKSTTDILNPIENLFNNSARRQTADRKKQGQITGTTNDHENYLDYNNSSYDFDSFIQSK